MKKISKSAKVKLDKEERELLKSYEDGEWTSVKNLKAKKVVAKKMAGKTLKKDVKINIRLSSADVSSIKQIAAFEGLPYQTLISSILHKFASGHLRGSRNL